MKEMKWEWIMGVAVWMAGVAGMAGEWAVVPRHGTRAGDAGGFEMGRTEVAVADFVEYLNGAGVPDFPETGQIVRRSGGTYAAKQKVGRQALSEVTPAEAEAYCRWRSQKSKRTVRLPTEAEWEAAARGGVDGAPFPWGWGGKVEEWARFAAPGPAPRIGHSKANGFGLVDMAGNLYEWCAPGAGQPSGFRAARGGSWAERDARRLEVEHRPFFAEGYRGQDVGFRVLREAKDREEGNWRTEHEP